MILIKTLINSVFFLISVSAFAQRDSIKNKAEKDIRTQGEQEEYWAQQAFEKNDGTQIFERYKGSIYVLEENKIKYDDVVLNIYGVSPSLRAIFEKGIFYPGLIAGNYSGEVLKTRQKIDSFPAKQNNFDILFGINNLSISYFDEIKSLSNSPKIKRFKIYLWRQGLANPSLYFLELTNNTATEETDIKTFINGAKITFFRFASILI